MTPECVPSDAPAATKHRSDSTGSGGRLTTRSRSQAHLTMHLTVPDKLAETVDLAWQAKAALSGADAACAQLNVLVQ